MSFFQLKIIKRAVYSIPIVPPYTLGACTQAFFMKRSDLKLCWACIDQKSIKIISPTTLSLGHAYPIRVKLECDSHPVAQTDVFVVRLNPGRNCEDRHWSLFLKHGDIDK